MPVIAVSCIKPLRVLSYVRSPKAKTKAQGWASVHIVTCPATEVVAACPRLGCDSPPRSRRSHRQGPCVGKSRLSPTPSPVQTATSWLPEQWEPAVHMLGCTLTGRHSFEFHRETETKNLKERTLTAEPTLLRYAHCSSCRTNPGHDLDNQGGCISQGTVLVTRSEIAPTRRSVP
ncbi:hypothetical protein N656DRAFT_310464 [Canariomyces notabilis]|uniref:Uncharacterized protein n=1 Tax=Canariomyces notabilis TaxID=2074819 RepID=A0AAN6QGZ3_9PEZI|nr:hypothetical protein N656DRAFT_310464 [Canariomyces arenarius]